MSLLNLPAGLKFYENELISSIQRAGSLLPLTKEANGVRLIPQEVNDNLQSMDSDVPHPLKCRYLVLYVYKTLASDATKFKKWLEILSSHGIDSGVLAKVKKENGTFSKMDDLTFKQWHVSNLTNILSNCAHKWEDIAFSLNCTEGEVQSIQKRAYIISMGDINVCLNTLFQRWVMRKYLNAKPPTLKSIKEVLRSETVGLGSEANSLQERFTRLIILVKILFLKEKKYLKLIVRHVKQK